MKTSHLSKHTPLSLLCVLFLSVGSAHAQSTEQSFGAIIGGSAGAIIGGKIDNKGSRSEGVVIGAVVGGSLGYIIGSEVEKDNEFRGRYNNQPGEYYTHNGASYRRYRNSSYGYVSFPVSSNDPYYYRDGRRKTKSHRGNQVTRYQR